MLRLKTNGFANVLALTPGAASKLDLLSDSFEVDRADSIFRKYWSSDAIFLVIGSVGAVVRLIAPLIENKESDPAVLVMDPLGKNIIPLLGGHIGGAEELASELAEQLAGNSIFTGFSRTLEKISIDSFGEVWGWKRSGDISSWNKLMIKSSKDIPILVSQTSGSNFWKNSRGAENTFDHTKIREKDVPFQLPDLNIGSKALSACCWHPATLWVGIGCERNTSHSLLERAFEESLLEASLAKEAVAGFATIDIKSDEIAIKALVMKEGLPLRLFCSKDLKKVNVPNPSELVNKEVGSPSVSEASALLAAGAKGNLKFTKHVYKSQRNEQGAVTISIAESIEPFAPQRGELHLVGSGPGDLKYLTNDSRAALSRSAIWIGYKRYLDLLEPLRRFDQVRIDGALKHELDRCQLALKLATQGIKVSLISSGDSGIYGMAGLALEVWLSQLKSERPGFKVHPGISAFQIAASKIGAPLMHDFCSISLSDCLTPWAKIQKRIEAAAASDFVIAFYNPRSQGRDWQLQNAIDILLKFRTKTTPTVVARQLGREHENIEVHLLGSVPIDTIDMLTLVLVGNSTSFFKDKFIVTPRGY